MASTLIGGRPKDRVVDDAIDVEHVTSEDMNTRANSDVLPDHIETVVDVDTDEGEPDR